MEIQSEQAGPLAAQTVLDVTGWLERAARHEAEGEHLAALGWVGGISRTVDDEKTALVREARAAGASWAEIGSALYISKQTAFNRYGEK